MLELLLVSNVMQDIARIKGLFSNSNYRVKVTTKNESAFDLIKRNPPNVCIYYAKNIDNKVFDFYKLIRSSSMITVPLVLLVEPEIQPVFTEYFAFKKSLICGSAITAENFNSMINKVASGEYSL